MVTFDPIARYEELRARLKILEQAGLCDSDEADEIDAELVEMERSLPEDYVHPDDVEFHENEM